MRFQPDGSRVETAWVGLKQLKAGHMEPSPSFLVSFYPLLLPSLSPVSMVLGPVRLSPHIGNFWPLHSITMQMVSEQLQAPGVDILAVYIGTAFLFHKVMKEEVITLTCIFLLVGMVTRAHEVPVGEGANPTSWWQEFHWLIV